MINLDSEIVATRFDGEACYYTLLRDGKRYTARVPLADLEKFGGNKPERRNFVSGALEARLKQAPDSDPPPPGPPTVPVIEPLPDPVVPPAPPPQPDPAPRPEAPAASPTTDPPYRPW